MRIEVKHESYEASVRLVSRRTLMRNQLKRKIAAIELRKRLKDEKQPTYADKNELDVADHRDASFLADQWTAEAREARELGRRGAPDDVTRGFYYGDN